jgi:hypothetical protein
MYETDPSIIPADFRREPPRGGAAPDDSDRPSPLPHSPDRPDPDDPITPMTRPSDTATPSIRMV